jgi:hypothetical protein
MITELEKQFFNTFGIEHEERYYNCKDNLEGKCGIKCPCECCDKSEEVYCYPQITDRHYLGLLAILNKKSSFIGTTIDELKEEALTDSIVYHLSIKEEVRALFEEKK